MLLNDRYLYVKSEDEVLDALATWLQHNIDNTDDRTLVDEIMRNVNWNFVSFERMLDIYKSFPRLRTNIHTKAIFHNQLKYRATKSKNSILLKRCRDDKSLIYGLVASAKSKLRLCAD